MAAVTKAPAAHGSCGDSRSAGVPSLTGASGRCACDLLHQVWPRTTSLSHGLQAVLGCTQDCGMQGHCGAVEGDLQCVCECGWAGQLQTSQHACHSSVRAVLRLLDQHSPASGRGCRRHELPAVQAPPAARPPDSVHATAARASPLHLPPPVHLSHRKQRWQQLRRRLTQAAAVHRVSLGCWLLRLLQSCLTALAWLAAPCSAQQVVEHGGA